VAEPKYTSANIVPTTDTFREWMDLTNRITKDMEDIVLTVSGVSQPNTTTGGFTQGNAVVNGIVQSNTITINASNTVGGLRGGTMSTPGDLVISTGSKNVISNSATLHVDANVSMIGTNIVFNDAASANGVINLSSNNVFIPSAQTVQSDAKNFLINGVNTNISSNLTVTGTETNIKGNITLGDAATDTVTFTGEVDSNIVPDLGTTETLGSASKRFKGFFSNVSTNTFSHVGATAANVQIIASEVLVQSATANSKLGVGTLHLGNSTANATGNSINYKIANSTTSVDITADEARINSDTDSSNLVANGTNINLGNTTVNTAISATAVNTDGTLAVLGAATLSNTLGVTGLITGSGGSTITGTANASVAMNIGANVNLSTSKITVGTSTANTTITKDEIATDGALSVTKASTLAGNVSAEANVSIGDRLTVTNTATFSNTVDVAGSQLLAQNDFEVRGNTVIGSAATDVASYKAQANTNFVPSTNDERQLGLASKRWKGVFSTVNAAGAVDFASTLSAGVTDITGKLSTTANVEVGTELTVGANSTLSGNLDVQASAILGSSASDVVIFNAKTNAQIAAANGTALGNTSGRYALVATSGRFSNDVVIGQTTTISNTGGIDMSGDLNVDGSVTLGSDDSDNIVVNGEINSDIVPNTNASHDLGSASKEFANVYADKIIVSSNSSFANLVQIANLEVTDSVILPSEGSFDVESIAGKDLVVRNLTTFAANTGSGANRVDFGKASNQVELRFVNAVSNGSIIPSTNTSVSIGNSTHTVANGFFNNSLRIGSNNATVSNTTHGTLANTTHVIADNIFARDDLQASYSSDRELKNNLTIIDTPVDKIKSIRGYQWIWNDKIGDQRVGTTEYGVVAQEVEQILPGAVSINSKGYKSVNYNHLSAVVIEAIRDLADKQDALATRLSELEAKING